jgi:type II secretory pathway component GspD/PulD (secretin)
MFARTNAMAIAFCVIALVNCFSRPEGLFAQESPDSGAVAKNDAPQDGAVAARTVQLAFREQEWLPALKWLATELELNLDWQSLPDGVFNLHSAQEYTLEEAEDLINLQLLGRGFTLLQRGEVLRVVPLKDIDVTLVPHIDPESLESSQPHQFVRISFPLEWMIADEAAKEFLPLMSPYGKLFPMASSNRLEAMDAVVNLREVHRLLTRAEKDEGRRERVAEFHLKYRKADEIASKVRQLVGLSPDSSSSAGQTQLDIEQARFKVEAVKQMGSGAKELLTDKKPSIFITVNDKENSILVNAPPNKIEIVRQAIDAMDKPLPPTASTWETIGRVKVHEVDGFDPETVAKLLMSLQERGNLAKETRIQHEAAYNRLIVFASADDHLTISQVIDSFRAQKRSATVLQLGSLDPAYAVKSVQLILKAPDRPSSAPGVASDGKFQIEADPEHRRLLLWATADEVTEVREFLIRLGESFSQSVATSQMHVISLNGTSMDAIAEKLEKLWQDMSDSPLIIDGRESKPESANESPKVNPIQLRNPEVKPASRDEASNTSPVQDRLRFVSAVDNNASAIGVSIDLKNNDSKNSSGKSPVRIVEGENGEVIVLSRDPLAAESARRLIEKLTPSTKDVRVIALKHAQALSVKIQLEAMLLHTMPATTSKLSTSPPMKIDVDTRTNRLLIQHASTRQMDLLSELVPIIDQPTSDDERLVRVQRVYRFQYRRAADVVDVVKEVYRDLLSINDRVFASYAGNRPTGYNQNLAATATNPEYQGLLAVGADKEANILIVSAPMYLIDDVIDLVKSIDTQVDGNAVAVVPFNARPADSKQQEVMSRLLGKPKK